jgi:hypothetical protein
MKVMKILTFFIIVYFQKDLCCKEQRDFNLP